MRPSRLVQAIGPDWFWVEFHAVMAVVWFVNIPIALMTGLKNSVPYLIVLSILTAFSGEMAAMHGAAVEEMEEST